MDTARNSYSIVKILDRSSYACVVCLKKLETPAIKLQCGCHILAHERCAPVQCPECKRYGRDKILAAVALLVCGLVCLAIVLLVLKFGYKII